MEVLLEVFLGAALLCSGRKNFRRFDQRENMSEMSIRAPALLSNTITFPSLRRIRENQNDIEMNSRTRKDPWNRHSQRKILQTVDKNSAIRNYPS